MKLNKLAASDAAIFAKYLNLSRHELAVYAFQNIFIWQGLFEINWTLIDDLLCVVFQDKISAFLNLAPLGKKITPLTVAKIFCLLDGLNKNPLGSRIENVETKDLKFYRALGLRCVEKPGDYLCSRSNLALLSGNKFKSKRASVNYFTKHYVFEYLPYSPGEQGACLKLYDTWKKQRQEGNLDKIYRGMQDDSRIALEVLLKNFRQLNYIGRVVKIDGKIKGFTFGYPLNSDTFCVLYEITDLSIKGLAQFIFREFSNELKDYKYLNIMDDSGLENLKKVKLSYHPAKLVPAYIVQR